MHLQTSLFLKDKSTYKLLIKYIVNGNKICFITAYIGGSR